MYLAVDIGGTKTLIASFNSDGKMVKQFKFPTSKDYDKFLEDFKIHIKELNVDDFKLAGVGVPGRLDRELGRVLALGNLPWKNEPIEADLEHITHCPVLIENDAKLAGLSEARLVDKYKKVLFLTISTGIGGALVVDGKLDHDTIDSEVGQIVVEHNGKLRRWEKFASGKAIVEKYHKKAVEIDDPKIWDEIARNIAIGLLDLVATLTPDVVIIGGSVGAHLDKFKARLNKHLKSYEIPLFSIPPVVEAKRPEEAVIYGAYELLKASHARITV